MVNFQPSAATSPVSCRGRRPQRGRDCGAHVARVLVEPGPENLRAEAAGRDTVRHERRQAPGDLIGERPVDDDGPNVGGAGRPRRSARGGSLAMCPPNLLRSWPDTVPGCPGHCRCVGCRRGRPLQRGSGTFRSTRGGRCTARRTAPKAGSRGAPSPGEPTARGNGAGISRACGQLTRCPRGLPSSPPEFVAPPAGQELERRGRSGLGERTKQRQSYNLFASRGTWASMVSCA